MCVYFLLEPTAGVSGIQSVCPPVWVALWLLVCMAMAEGKLYTIRNHISLYGHDTDHDSDPNSPMLQVPLPQRLQLLSQTQVRPILSGFSQE